MAAAAITSCKARDPRKKNSNLQKDATRQGEEENVRTINITHNVRQGSADSKRSFNKNKRAGTFGKTPTCQKEKEKKSSPVFEKRGPRKTKGQAWTLRHRAGGLCALSLMENDGHVYDETSRTLRCNLFKGKSATRLLRSLQEHAGTLEHLQVQLVNLTLLRTVALTKPVCSPLADNWTMRRTWPLCLKSCPAASRS